MTSQEYRAVMMNAGDNVATALCEIPAHAVVELVMEDTRYTVSLREAVEFGHKFAVKPIQSGDDVMKYGQVIGSANQDIQPGQHVHVHNLEGKRGRGDKIDRSN